MDKMAAGDPLHSASSMASGTMDEATKRRSAPSPRSARGEGLALDLQGMPRFLLDLQHIQPTLNIMTCGDVSHGKSTLLQALSGEATMRHSAAKKRNMTIRLGYTSCKIWKCLLCPPPRCYFSTASAVSADAVQCIHCGAAPDRSHREYERGTSEVVLLRHLSFVDVPGHAELMLTMVSAASVADAAILVVDASKRCPGKQAAQHLDAVHLLGLMRRRQLIVAQNKVDLTDRQRACVSHEEIRRFLGSFGDGTLRDDTPIVPLSAQSKLNIDALSMSIVRFLPKCSPKLRGLGAVPRSISVPNAEPLRANIIRSFDVNRARDVSSIADIDRIAGGVLGAAVLSGRIAVGQAIEIRPGYLTKKKTSRQRDALRTRLQPQWGVQPIRTTVKSLRFGRESARRAFPGGNVGIETNVDPSLTAANGLCGHVLVDADDPDPPPVFNKMKMSFHFLSPRQRAFQCDGAQFEWIRLNVGAFKMRAEVVAVGVGSYRGILCVLEAPICARIGDEVGICRQNRKREWSFVGGGVIRETKNILIAGDRERVAVGGPSGTLSSVDTVRERERHRVHIRYQQRSGRKGVTLVVGLRSTLRLKKLVNAMKREWATGATIVEHEKIGPIIQLQGDRRRVVGPFLSALNVVEASQVTVHGD